MKLAVAAEGCDLMSPVASQFEHARYLVLFNSASGAWGAYDMKKHCGWPFDALITGQIGRAELHALRDAGVLVYVGAAGTARQAIDQYQAGRLTCAVYAPSRLLNAV
jgi:predicted Fe-Mo cluster-binding NifX family protein